MADDFGPATSVMNMSFTYHFTSVMIPGKLSQILNFKNRNKTC